MPELGRALVDLHDSKDFPTHARDEFYIGPIYEATGPKVRPSWRRRQAAPARGSMQAPAAKGPKEAPQPPAAAAPSCVDKVTIDIDL